MRYHNEKRVGYHVLVLCLFDMAVSELISADQMNIANAQVAVATASDALTSDDLVRKRTKKAPRRSLGRRINSIPTN